jgi:hypothetical protein
MMGILFAHKVAPSEIEAMDFGQMKYWSDLARNIDKQKLKAIREAGKR